VDCPLRKELHSSQRFARQSKELWASACNALRGVAHAPSARPQIRQIPSSLGATAECKLSCKLCLELALTY
jgi:hypothetical protein